jgi:organic radical activating enzyme
MNKRPLCYAPFVGIYAPCCVSENFVSDDPDVFWTSKTMQDIRQSLLDQKFPESCNYCKVRVEKNRYNDIHIWDDFVRYELKNIKCDIVEYGNETKGPVQLDFRTSNKCNFKCRMCVPSNSDKIEEEVKNNVILKQYYNKTIYFDNELPKLITDSKFKNIKLLGGEPTLDPQVLEYLEHILNTYDELPVLRITTNGSNFNQRFQNILEKFNTVKLRFSVDGTDEVYNYIRTNGNWEKTKNIIEKTIQLKTIKKFGFNIVLMPYNIFNLTKLLDWLYTIYKEGYEFDAMWDTSDADHTGIPAVLPEHKKQCLDSINEWISNADRKFIKMIKIDNIVNVLENTEYQEECYNTFKRFNNTLDNIRKTNLLNLDKRFKEYV